MTRSLRVSLVAILVFALTDPLVACAQQPIRKALKRRSDSSTQKPATDAQKPAPQPVVPKTGSTSQPDGSKHPTPTPEMTDQQAVVPASGTEPAESQDPDSPTIVPASGVQPSAENTDGDHSAPPEATPAGKSSLPSTAEPSALPLAKPLPRTKLPLKRTAPELPSSGKSTGSPSKPATQAEIPPAGTKSPTRQVPKTAKKAGTPTAPAKSPATQAASSPPKKPSAASAAPKQVPAKQAPKAVVKAATPPKTTMPVIPKPYKPSDTTEEVPENTIPGAQPPTPAKPASLVPMPLIVDSQSLVPNMPAPAPKAEIPSTSDETQEALPTLPTDNIASTETAPNKDAVPMPTRPVELLSPVPDDDSAPQPIKHSEPEAAPNDFAPTQFATESAPWQSPLDVAIGPDGSHFVADRKLPGIWRMKDGQTTAFYKGPQNPRAPMGAVRSLFVAADGTLYAGDAATKDVYSVSPSGEIKSLARNSVGIPNSISVVDGTLYVADIEQQKIWRLPAGGLGIAQQPTQFADVPGCRGLYIDELGFIWVVSTIQPQLRRYTGDGNFDPVFEDVTFEFPQQVCVTLEGTAYVSDSAAKTVWRIERGGQPEKWLTSPHLSTPNRIVQQGDHFIVSDAKANSLFQVSKFAAIELMINGTKTKPESTASAAETTPPKPTNGITTKN